MDIREIAQDFTAMLKSGQMDEAGAKWWSQDIATYEPMPGEMSETHGMAETLAKQQWWTANHEIHNFRAEGPYVHGDQFLVWMSIDVTPREGERTEMTEVVAYTVRDGRVVEERYFY